MQALTLPTFLDTERCHLTVLPFVRRCINISPAQRGGCVYCSPRNKGSESVPISQNKMPSNNRIVPTDLTAALPCKQEKGEFPQTPRPGWVTHGTKHARVVDPWDQKCKMQVDLSRRLRLMHVLLTASNSVIKVASRPR